MGWLLLEQAAVALEVRAAGRTRDVADLADGKVAGASFFAMEILPRLSADKAIVERAEPGDLRLFDRVF